MRRIAEIRSPVDRAKVVGELEARDELSREKSRLFKEQTRGLFHIQRGFASGLIEPLYQLDASAICLGYPLNIAHEWTTSSLQTFVLTAG